MTEYKCKSQPLKKSKNTTTDQRNSLRQQTRAGNRVRRGNVRVLVFLDKRFFPRQLIGARIQAWKRDPSGLKRLFFPIPCSSLRLEETAR